MITRLIEVFGVFYFLCGLLTMRCFSPSLFRDSLQSHTISISRRYLARSIVRPIRRIPTQTATGSSNHHVNNKLKDDESIQEKPIPINELMSMYLQEETLDFLETENDLDVEKFDPRKTVYLESNALEKRTKTPSIAKPYTRESIELPSSAIDVADIAKKYPINQQISVRIVKFGYLGASVIIDDNPQLQGLILQREIMFFRESRRGVDIVVDEVLTGFVEKVNEDGRINVSLRPVGVARLQIIKTAVLEALNLSPNKSLPIGDKSSPELIASYFHGMSKQDFKNAIGVLYKESKVLPSAHSIQLMTTDQQQQSQQLIQQSQKLNPFNRVLQSNEESIFIGNLPIRLSEKFLRESVNKIITTSSLFQKWISDKQGK